MARMQKTQRSSFLGWVRAKKALSFHMKKDFAVLFGLMVIIHYVTEYCLDWLREVLQGQRLHAQEQAHQPTTT